MLSETESLLPFKKNIIKKKGELVNVWITWYIEGFNFLLFGIVWKSTFNANGHDRVVDCYFNYTKERITSINRVKQQEWGEVIVYKIETLRLYVELLLFKYCKSIFLFPILTLHSC